MRCVVNCAVGKSKAYRIAALCTWTSAIVSHDGNNNNNNNIDSNNRNMSVFTLGNEQHEHYSLLENKYYIQPTASCVPLIKNNNGSCNLSLCRTWTHVKLSNATLAPQSYCCSIRSQASAGNARSGRSSSSSQGYGRTSSGGSNNINNNSSSYSSYNNNNNNNNNNNKDAARLNNTPFKKKFNSTADEELSRETVAAMRDDGIILEELFRNIPPNGAISLKSLSALISDNVKEAVSEKHNGLISFIRERKHFFLLKERPEDKVFFVAANPLARQRFATREVQKRTMRDLMGLNSESGYGDSRGGYYSRGNNNNNYNNDGGSNSNNNNNYSRSRGRGGYSSGGNNFYNNNNNSSNSNRDSNRDSNRYGQGNEARDRNERYNDRGNYNDRRSGGPRGGDSNSNYNNNSNRSNDQDNRSYGRERSSNDYSDNNSNSSSRDGGNYQRRSFNNNEGRGNGSGYGRGRGRS